MNIFAVSPDARECARMLDDRRLNKMVLETAQILSTVSHTTGMLKATDMSKIYRPTHRAHPCVLWPASQKIALNWCLNLLDELGMEFSYRTGREHASHHLLMYWPRHDEFMTKPKVFVNCSAFKCCVDVHEAYKETMRLKWDKDFLGDFTNRWTNRNPPEWFTPWETLS